MNPAEATVLALAVILAAAAYGLRDTLSPMASGAMHLLALLAALAAMVRVGMP